MFIGFEMTRAHEWNDPLRLRSVHKIMARRGMTLVIDHVLQPGEVGIASWRDAIFPSRVFLQLITTPFPHIEGRGGHDVISAQVRVQVAGEGVGWLSGEVEIHAADGHVHGSKSPCGQG